MRVWDRLYPEWLPAMGKNPKADPEKDIAPMTPTQSAEYVIRRYEIACSPAEIIDQWQRMILECYKTAIPLKEETADIARELHKAGLRLAVVTSCFPAVCEAILRRYGLRPLFSAILYTDDEAARDKSFPDIWLSAADRLGLDCAECIVFEDAYHALTGAHAAGMSFVAVYDHTCTEWRLMKSKAEWQSPKDFALEFRGRNILFESVS
jgi:pseudouridine-5'-monophosphatase